MSGHDVTVRIDELVLVGFDQDDRDLAVSALREELAVLLSSAVPRHLDAARASLRFELGHDRGPAAVGRAAARSIAAHLGGARG